MREWTEKEILFLKQNSHMSAPQLSKHINRSVGAIKQKAARMGIDIQKRRHWTDEEIAFLKQNSNMSASELSKHLRHSKNAINEKAARDNIDIKKQRKKWSKKETKQFREDWYDERLSNKTLCKKYKRSLVALRNQASIMKLGQRIQGKTSLTIGDIVREMQVSKDRVRKWLKNGLKHRVLKNKMKRYFISQEDLLEFLHNNPKIYDASLISEYLFIDEPDWLKQKRIADKGNFRRKQGIAYTNEEVKTIVKLFKTGKSNERIADAIKRTPAGVAKILDELGLSRHRYNDYEIEIIKANLDKTPEELSKLLPLRKITGIKAKLCKLKRGENDDNL